ncbi:hypothetical protein MPSEU_000573800 [Mayamaea pseudoterrestris]|nr:hypothetical protein MPSEU_000573800 [Mayamaea pseudoterrestris]
MGNRVKGKVKKKSIKAALGSSASSKRKLSRMGKRQKAHHAGLEASFIGRSKCLKMLQITLKDFRRLCILKGIYPREPIGRAPGNKKGQTFYHIKDVRAIAHEPVLEKFRAFRAFMKKVRRAAGRNERDEASRKHSLVPTYSIHHLVKERYPRFMDALGDLDDALTLTYLFAALPSEGSIKASVVNKAKSLAAAWGAYCATTSVINKAFISVKGVYMEADVQGQAIRWIVPHSFTQYLPQDVDYRVMMTFFEFYEVLLKFVLFKLFGDIGVRYPLPSGARGASVGSTSAVLAGHLKALKSALDSSSSAISDVVKAAVDKEQQPAIATSPGASLKATKEWDKAVGAALNSLPEMEESDDEDDAEEDDVDIAGPLKAALDNMVEEQARTLVPALSDHLNDDGIKRKRLFAGLTFFFSREIPRGYLELVCLAYGGNFGWEGDESPISSKDPSITHHIVDRPKLQASYESLPNSREFVQPQWIIDCANNMFILPVAKYAVGASLPPHLSPWVDNDEEGYKPAYAEEIERLKNGEDPLTIELMEVEATTVDQPGLNELTSTGEKLVDDNEEVLVDESDDEDDDPEEKKRRADRRRQKEEEEAQRLAKTMMSKKATHLYNRMQHGLAQKKEKVEILHQRRREIESTKEKDASGKTPLKQKVERLKKERKVIEDSYAQNDGTMKKSKKIKH